MRPLSRIISSLVVSVPVCIALFSCVGNVVYNKYVHTGIDGWEKNDTLFFEVPRMKSSGRYGAELGLRATGEFPFTGVTLVVRRTVIPGNVVFSDTLACRITDEKGNALGSGVSSFQYSFNLPDIELDEGDSLSVCVWHIMRREMLPGLSDVGLKVYSGGNGGK